MRTLKKILSITLVLAMVLSTFAFNTSAVAEGATFGLVVRADKTEAEIVPDAVVTVTIHFAMANWDQLMSDMRLCLVYDKSVYTPDVSTRTFLGDLANYAKDATVARDNDTFGQTCLTAAGADADELALYDGGVMIQVGADTTLGAAAKKGWSVTEEADGVSVAEISMKFTVTGDEAAIAAGTKDIKMPATVASANQYIKYTDGSSTPKQYETANADFSQASILANMPEEDPCKDGHTPAEVIKENIIPATCGEDGSHDDVVYCSVCKELISRTSVVDKATGEHVYAKEIDKKEPTCTEDGYVVKACGCSDNEVQRETLPATGHSEKSVVTKPTCTEAGYTTYTCSVCQNVRTADEVPAKGHSYRDKVTAPTCTEDGYTTYKCSVCGDIKTGDEVPATGHNYETVVTAPTCTEDGYTTYTCTADKCGDTYTSDVVPATGHKYEATAVKQPTCSKPGYTTYTCPCGDSYKEEIPSTNHTNADGTSALVEIPAVPATCKSYGSTAGQMCSICNTQTIIPERVEKIDHTWDAGVVTAPTYTSEGYTTYTCTVCSETKIDDKVPALTPDTPDTPDVPETAAKFAIKEPAVTKLRYMDEMLLHTVMPSDAPEGAYVKWTVVEGDGYFRIMEDNGDGKLRITPKEEGWTTFRATLYDASGNVLATDEIEMFSRAHLFDKIGGIIRYIFGSNIKYEK